MKKIMSLTIIGILIGCSALSMDNPCLKHPYPLHQAAKVGDIQKMEQLIQQGYDINHPNQQQITPLHIAARYGQKETAELLLKHGAKVDSFSNDKDKGTPLHHAVSYGYTDLARILLNYGANINLKEKSCCQCTPLHSAIGKKYQQMLQLLIERNADLTIPDKYGETPLHRAASIGWSTGIRLLVAANPTLINITTKPINSCCSSFCNPCGPCGTCDETDANTDEGNNMYCCNPCGGDCLTCCCNDTNTTGDQNTNTENTCCLNRGGNTPLHNAAMHLEPHAVHTLLELGANVNAMNDNNETPLHYAVHINPKFCCPCPDPECKNKDDIKKCTKEIIDELIKHGAQLEAQNENGNTPLHTAASCNNSIAIEHLKNHGANIQATTLFTGASPLHVAALNHNHSAIKKLLKCGANVNAQDNFEGTSLHDAVRVRPDCFCCYLNHNPIQDLEKTITLLIKKGAQVKVSDQNRDTPLDIAASNNNSHAIRFLIKNGASINRQNQNRNGYTALHRTIDDSTKNNVDALRELIRLNADYTIGDELEQTPLHLAAEQNKLKALKVLLDAPHSDPNIKGFYVQTPLHYAVGQNNFHTSRLLIRRGAHLDVQDLLGKTPLDCLNSNNEQLTHYIQKVVPATQKLHSAIKNKDFKQAHEALHEGADLAAQDETGNLPLYQAVLSNDQAMTLLILAHKPNGIDLLSLKNKDGQTVIDLLQANPKQMNTFLEAAGIVERQNNKKLIKNIWLQTRPEVSEAILSGNPSLAILRYHLLNRQ